jgi:hypothetical protein
MLRRVALVGTYVSDERSASFIRVTRIGELRRTLAVTSNLRMMRRNTKLASVVRASVIPSSPILVTLMEALSASETSVLTRATCRNIPDDAVIQCCCNFGLWSRVGWKVYIAHDICAWNVVRVMGKLLKG